MPLDRRHFLATAALGLGSAACQSPHPAPAAAPPDYTDLDAALARPVLRREYFPDPVIIETCELLEYNGSYLVRVRSRDGAVGLCAGHNIRMPHLWPIQTQLVNPFFIGKDARDLDRLMHDVTMHKNIYKYQGYPIWIPIATVEMAILDLLGSLANKSMGELVGDLHQTEIAIYQANNNRWSSAEESLEKIKALRESTGAKAVKFKCGGRRSNPEPIPGRTEKLIPLLRPAFGDDITIYADCNGSYEGAEAIRIGKLLEQHDIDLYEQPVPTDYYEDWKAVADAVDIPIASGGGEVSLRNFRWLIGNDAVQMVQQDLFYFGGMIRCMKVARMAAARGLPCVPHISGTGLGYIYMMHFVSAIPNAGPYHEFKGVSQEVPFTCDTSSLKPEEGILKLPKGVGSGVEIDPDFWLSIGCWGD
ncbi:MAG: mandelate racemase/muconate lactonizing enzyme family protein [Bacteroidota bacterium]